MAKYGTFKYGKAKYGVFISAGEGNITPAASFIKLPIKKLGQGVITPIGTMIKSIFKTAGQGVITPIADISKLIIKKVGEGSVSIASILEKLKFYYLITVDRILSPLNVRVLGDSRQELIPGTRDNVEEIPGRHGEIDFGSEFKARTLELKIASFNGLTPIQKMQIKRQVAKHLNPANGYRILIFEDDPTVEYNVKYSGKIDVGNYPTFIDFTIPFKMADPFMHSTNCKTLIGGGNIINEGTFETGLTIEVPGEVTNPTVQIGSEILKYTGTIPAGKKLIIDTKNGTAKIDDTNALGDLQANLPILVEPGKTAVTAGENVTIRWKDRYL